MGVLTWCVLLVGVVGAQCGRWQPKTPRHGGFQRDAPAPSFSEQEAVKFFADFDKLAAEHDNKLVLAEWAYESNITDHNLKQKVLYNYYVRIGTLSISID